MHAVFCIYLVLYVVYQYKAPYHFHKTLYVHYHSYYYNLCYIKVEVSIEMKATQGVLGYNIGIPICNELGQKL